jgi:integrase
VTAAVALMAAPAPAAASRDACAVAADGGHVFGAGCAGIGPAAARLAARIDPAFLAEAGWDPATRVLSLPPGHPLLGWRACQADGCSSQAYGSDRICGACSRGEETAGSAGRGATPAAVAGRGRCQVDACPRDRTYRRYCRAHHGRLLEHRRADPSFDERAWRATEPAAEGPGQVSLHGLHELAIAEILYGLQQRTRGGTTSDVARLRQVAWELRRARACRLGLLEAGGQEHHKLARCFIRHVGRAFLDPETERVKDRWDLAAFGLSGNLDFTRISQGWLREAAKRWAADDLPRRRGKDTAGPVRHYLVSVAALSESLRATRADHGTSAAGLGRADIDSFVRRLAFLAAGGRLSADARTRICREARHLLGRFRALGLTRPGGPAAGLGDDFTLTVSDIPRKSEDPEAGRDLPPEIMRQLCEHLPALEHAIACREVRVAVELIIDTGRRPDEICALSWDCLEYSGNDRLPALAYDNHKNARPGRRLPIAQATAELITAQKTRVREQFPHTPLAELKLLPAAYANPHGRRAIGESHLGSRHRAWIASLPLLPQADGTEFDKSRIVPYAYRHTYAQRHADAGVPVDVLGALMDHRSLDTTKNYYSVGDERRREAVDRVTALQFDRHGNRIWRSAKALLDAEHARRGVGEVAVPFGICAEPSNVKAGGHACPFRFRCAGCDHFRTDVSYLPDLHAYLDDLLRNRERLLASCEVDDWARAEAMPSDEEITRIRRLITQITTGLGQFPSEEREQIDQAVAVVRRHRTVMLGVPRIRQALPDIRPERTA